MKQFFTLFLVLCTISLFANVKSEISWTASIIEDETAVITDGELVEALNFSSGLESADFNTTINGVTFTGAVSGEETNAFANPTFDYFSTTSLNVVPPAVDNYDIAVGLESYDVLMSKFLWDSDPDVITLSNLEVGGNYKVQLFVGDTRASQSGAYMLIDDTFGDSETTLFVEEIGLSILGEFTADATTVEFTISKVFGGNNQGISLNGYQLRKMASTESSGIKWSSSVIMDETAVLTEGKLVEALNFTSGLEASDFTSTVNGVTFEGAVSGEETNAFATPTFDYFSTTSLNVVPPAVDNYDAAVGLDVYDVLMSKFLWDNDVDVITLSNLVVGDEYAVQLLIADTRASQSGSYMVIDGDFGDEATTSFVEEIGLSIVGEFTADESTVEFSISKVKDGIEGGISLNAYQLRNLSESDENGILNFNQLNGTMKAYFVSEHLLKIESAAKSCSVYNMSGKLIENVDLENNSSINTSNYNPGLYLLKSSNYKAAKFIVE